MNYELIYKVRKARLRTDSFENLRNQLRFKADEEAAKLHNQYQDFLKKNLPEGTNFEVTNIACNADGIIGCVYTWKGDAPEGLGKRVCCFCGCDDFD
jgi:hypothetical protein